MNKENGASMTELQAKTWQEKAKELYKIQQRRKEMEAVEEILKEELKTLSGGSSFAFGGFRFGFTEQRGNIDYKSIPALKGIDLEMYRKPSVKYWKLSLELQDA